MISNQSQPSLSFSNKFEHFITALKMKLNRNSISITYKFLLHTSIYELHILFFQERELYFQYS